MGDVPKFVHQIPMNAAAEMVAGCPTLKFLLVMNTVPLDETLQPSGEITPIQSKIKVDA